MDHTHLLRLVIACAAPPAARGIIGRSTSTNGVSALGTWEARDRDRGSERRSPFPRMSWLTQRSEEQIFSSANDTSSRCQSPRRMISDSYVTLVLNDWTLSSNRSERLSPHGFLRIIHQVSSCPNDPSRRSSVELRGRHARDSARARHHLRPPSGVPNTDTRTHASPVEQPVEPRAVADQAICVVSNDEVGSKRVL